MPLYEEVLGQTDVRHRDASALHQQLSRSSPRPEVQYRLAENYRILKKSPDAVGLYLTRESTPHETATGNPEAAKACCK